jgi:hypothetical protein
MLWSPANDFTHARQFEYDRFIRILTSKGWWISPRTVNRFYILYWRHNSKVRIIYVLYIYAQKHTYADD